MQLEIEFGSSGTLTGIQDVIAAFYCGERKTLEPTSTAEWTVHFPDGRKVENVGVLKSRGRYRFGKVSNA